MNGSGEPQRGEVLAPSRKGIRFVFVHSVRTFVREFPWFDAIKTFFGLSLLTWGGMIALGFALALFELLTGWRLPD